MKEWSSGKVSITVSKLNAYYFPHIPGYFHLQICAVFNLTLILQTNVEKWQSKTLFLKIFDPRSSIVKSVFDCPLTSVSPIRFFFGVLLYLHLDLGVIFLQFFFIIIGLGYAFPGTFTNRWSANSKHTILL